MHEQMTNVNDICRFLDWDSAFFGFQVAQVIADELTKETLPLIFSWCKKHEIRCLYLLVDSDKTATTYLAEANGFHLVDIRLTMVKSLVDMPSSFSSSTIRSAKPEDMHDLKEIAAASHSDSRFYNDSGFPRHLADDLYRTWIEKSINGYADAVLVAEHLGKPVGYISCHLDSQNDGRIGLVAISPRAQRQGVGTHLINSALRWFGERSITSVTVVTQGRNIAAQRLYQRCGFLTQSLQLWYHLWFPAHEERKF